MKPKSSKKFPCVPKISYEREYTKQVLMSTEGEPRQKNDNLTSH